MSDNDVNVKFGADTASVNAGIQQVGAGVNIVCGHLALLGASLD
jgi:hypothetical protein